MAFDLIIADPSPTMKKIYQTALPETQYRLHFASNLEELFHLLETVSPELIITDQAIYENSAALLEFRQRLKTEDDIPVFLTAGLFDRLSGDYVQQLQPEKVLVKPFSLDAFLNTIRDVIEKKHLPDTLPEELPEVREQEIGPETEGLPLQLQRQVQLLVRQEMLETERELEKRIKASLLRELRLTESSAGGSSATNNKPEGKG